MPIACVDELATVAMLPLCCVTPHIHISHVTVHSSHFTFTELVICLPAQDVSTRACYLFCRLSKSVRNNLRPYLPNILTSLEGHLARIATTPVGDVPGVQVRREDMTRCKAPLY
jgi:hypothetical protein